MVKLTAQFKELSDDLVAGTPFDQFALDRFYNDGGFITVFEDAENAVNQNIQLGTMPSAQEIRQIQETYVLLTPQNATPKGLKEPKFAFNTKRAFDSGLVSRYLILMPHSDYIDVACFLARKFDGEVLDYIARETPYLTKIAKEFITREADLLSNLASHRIFPEVDSKVRELLPRKLQEVFVRTAYGWTAIETANSLGISKRTVESYLEEIKNKLVLSSKNQIRDYFFEHRLELFYPYPGT